MPTTDNRCPACGQKITGSGHWPKAKAWPTPRPDSTHTRSLPPGAFHLSARRPVAPPPHPDSFRLKPTTKSILEPRGVGGAAALMLIFLACAFALFLFASWATHTAAPPVG